MKNQSWLVVKFCQFFNRMWQVEWVRVTQHLNRWGPQGFGHPTNITIHPSIHPSQIRHPQAGDGWHWPRTFSSLGINLSNFSAKDVRQVARLFLDCPGVSALLLLQIQKKKYATFFSTKFVQNMFKKSKSNMKYEHVPKKKDAKFVDC